MAPSAHSTFSASASSRLLACPGSYALAIAVDDGMRKSSVFSAEGTLAHAMSEAVLHTGISPMTFVGETRTADGFEFTVDEEMADAVQSYVDYVRGLKVMGYEVMLETRVSPAGLWDGLDALDVELFGTSDVIAYNHQTQDLRIVDLKFGRGVAVEAYKNSQLLYYAAGALAHIGQTATIKTVTATIVQPRAFHAAGPIRWHSYSADEVTEWARTTLYEGVKKALSDNGQTTLAGKHCRFCPVAPHCETTKTLAMDAAKQAFLAAPAQNLPASAPASAVLPQVTLTDEALGELLDKIEIVGPWLEAVRKLALERLEAGTPVPGWKLVPKRATRKYAEADTIDTIEAMRLDPRISDADMDAITELSLLSPAQAEKKLGKKRFEEIVGPYVVKQSSGLTLAPEVDPRSVAARRTAQEAFGLPGGASTTP